MLPASGAGARAAGVHRQPHGPAQVKRAAVGAEGFVVDHYSRPALDAYLQSTGGRLWQAFAGGRPPYAIFCDSLEVFGARIGPPIFSRRSRAHRGYDLLAALARARGW